MKVWVVDCFDPRGNDLGGHRFIANGGCYMNRKSAARAERAAIKSGLATSIMELLVLDFAEARSKGKTEGR